MKTRVPLLVLAASWLVTATFMHAETQDSGKTETASGLITTTFATAKGSVKVSLPADMAAGDTISGTVVSDPAGKNAQEKRQNAGELQGYVVELENRKSPVSGGVIRGIVLPPQPAAPVLILLDAKGKPIATATIPIAPPNTYKPEALLLPGLGQAGRPIEIQGPFDGDSSNTKAKVGDANAQVLAESPRKAVIENPRETVGPTRIQIAENGNATTGSFRNLKIDLTAPKTSLLKGESTELHVQVSGLEGLTQPINVQLQNQSPSTVNLGGGTTQVFTIPPAAVSSSGTFVSTQPITGVSNGAFNITSGILSQLSQTIAPTPSPGSGQSTQPPRTQTLGPAPSTGTQQPSPSPTASGTKSNTKSGGGITAVKTEGQGGGGNATAVAVETDCCKKIRAQNDDQHLRFMKDGKGFELLGNKLIMTVDGKTSEWTFTNPDGSALNIEYIFCHLTNNLILSQLSQALVSHVVGGKVVEKGKTQEVSLAGPYPGEVTQNPYYFFQFLFQNIDTGVKEGGITFVMDAEHCTWTVMLTDGDKSTWCGTGPARTYAQITQALINTRALEEGFHDNPWLQGIWWGTMYRFIGEIQEHYGWLEEHPDAQELRNMNWECYYYWVAKLRNALTYLSNNSANLTSEQNEMVKQMAKQLDDLQEFLSHPPSDSDKDGQKAFATEAANRITKVLISFNKLWMEFRQGVKFQGKAK